jgi:hypothetical protein
LNVARYFAPPTLPVPRLPTRALPAIDELAALPTEPEPGAPVLAFPDPTLPLPAFPLPTLLLGAIAEPNASEVVFALLLEFVAPVPDEMDVAPTVLPCVAEAVVDAP